MTSCEACKLRRKRMFRSTSAGELAAIAAMKTEHRVVTAGRDVIRQGERGRIFCTLYSGWAIRYVHVADGTRQILEVVLPGETVGLAGVLRGTHAHSVQALTEAEFCILDGRHFVPLAQQHTDLAMDILRARVEDERRADMRLTALGRMSAAERIGYFALEIYDRLGQRGMATGTDAPFPLRRIDVADAVGLSRVHVIRALRELRSERLMQIEAGTLSIPDVGRLAEFAGFVPAPRNRKRVIL